MMMMMMNRTYSNDKHKDDDDDDDEQNRQLITATSEEWKELVGWTKFQNEDVLAKVEEDRQIMKISQQRQHHWIWHILRHKRVTAGCY